MIISKIINKLYKITLIMFLLLSVFTLINKNPEKVLRTNVEIKNIEEVPKTEVYLLSDNNYLVRANIYLESNSIEEKAKKIIEYIKINNKNLPQGLNGYLIDNVTVNKVNIEDNNLRISFSNEFLNIKNKDLVISGLVYSLTKLPNIETIEVLVEDSYLENYNYKLNKDIGINKEYLLNDRSDIKQVTIYYYTEINNIDYLTPVTKYINDEREKVEIIIDELSNNVPDYLVGYLNDKTKLVDFKEDNSIMVLNFDKEFKSSNNIINQKTTNLIAESIFENYDLNFVFFQENSKKIDFIKKKQ